MTRLYEAENNVMNYLVLQYSDGTCKVIDWDVSDEEVAEAVKRFENGEIEQPFSSNRLSEEEAFCGLFNKRLLTHK